MQEEGRVLLVSTRDWPIRSIWKQVTGDFVLLPGSSGSFMHPNAPLL